MFMRNFKLFCLEECGELKERDDIERSALLARLLPDIDVPLSKVAEISPREKFGLKGNVELVNDVEVDFTIDDDGNVIRREIPRKMCSVCFDTSGNIMTLVGFDGHDVMVSSKYGMLNVPAGIVNDSYGYMPDRRIDYVLHFHSSEKEKYHYDESGELTEIRSTSGSRRQYVYSEECEAVRDYDAAGVLQLTALYYTSCAIVQSRYVTFKCFFDNRRRVKEAHVYMLPGHDSEPLIVRYTYNSQDDVVAEIQSGGIVDTYDYEYDSHGNWTVMRRYRNKNLVAWNERKITYCK